MSKFFGKVNAFFMAKSWGGASWLLSLCIALLVLAGGYIWVHKGRLKGKEYVQLNSAQVQTLNNVINVYPDTGTTSPFAADVIQNRKLRDQAVVDFLQSEYRGDLDEQQELELKNLLSKFNNKDIGNYFTDKRIIIKSFFWLVGSDVYLEALLWSLFGVLVSLIYYVSLAYSKSLNVAGDDESGKFDPSELPSQIAKMFYAPATTIVIVLGYHLLSNGSSSMVDIFVNKGLIIFSFVSGFFSSRLMKFLDKLKDLLLPVSEKTDNNTAIDAAKTDISVKLKLTDSFAQTPDGQDIAKAGFKTANVTLTPEGGGDDIKLESPADDTKNIFNGKLVPAGNYVLKGSFTYKKDETVSINLEGKQPIAVSKDKSSFELTLDKTVDE